jgi:hypothetical protein
VSKIGIAERAHHPSAQNGIYVIVNDNVIVTNGLVDPSKVIRVFGKVIVKKLDLFVTPTWSMELS